MLDMNLVDVIQNTTMTPSIVEDYFDKEQYEDIKNEIINNQLTKLEDLTINKLDSIQDEKIKQKIYLDILDFVTNNVFSVIPGLDPDNVEGTQTIASALYQFLVVYIPHYLPKIMENLKVVNVTQLEKKIFKKCVANNDWTFFANAIKKHFENILQILNKLQKLDSKVVKETFFKKLLADHVFYIELIDQNDLSKFYDYFVTVARKVEI